MGLERQNEFPVPPRLTMEEYVEFVGASMLLIDPEKARRQKELEENIQVMFSLRNPRISPSTLEL
jgi:ABC-type Na+ transport system ATPase subunit NatA